MALTVKRTIVLLLAAAALLAATMLAAPPAQALVFGGGDFDIDIEADQDIDASGGDGGEQDAVQRGGDQTATATGPTFDASQFVVSRNLVML